MVNDLVKVVTRLLNNHNLAVIHCNGVVVRPWTSVVGGTNESDDTAEAAKAWNGDESNQNSAAGSDEASDLGVGVESKRCNVGANHDRYDEQSQRQNEHNELSNGQQNPNDVSNGLLTASGASS